jgi:hypothetical protein
MKSLPLLPAQAGIQAELTMCALAGPMGSRLRGNERI